jgi:hypothetical protein
MTAPDPQKQQKFRTAQRDRLERYLRIAAEHGPEAAREELLRGYPEIQRAKMGPLIEGVPLITGFQKAVALFAAIGVEEEVVDVSAGDTDAVLEISLTCMCRNAYADAGLDPQQATPALCELDFEASRRAFPELSVRAECRQAEGAHLCVFRYSRPQQPS